MASKLVKLINKTYHQRYPRHVRVKGAAKSASKRT